MPYWINAAATNFQLKWAIHLESRVVMEPRFCSQHNRFSIYVQRPSTLIDDAVFTITTKFDDCLGRLQNPLKARK
mgnify:CR=1 FL=1